MSLHYRAVVQFDAARSLFVASAPELGCAGEGPTRAEALSQLEDALAARVAQLRDEGAPVPEPVDDEPAPAADDAAGGALQIAVTPTLRRSLLVQARAEGTSLDQLAGELLAEALAVRQLGGRRSDRRAGAPEPRRDDPQGGDPDRDRGRPPRGPGAGPGRARYQAIMDDKATFLEYVRGLESGNRAGGGAPGGRGGPPPRGRGRGPGGGGSRGDG